MTRSCPSLTPLSFCSQPNMCQNTRALPVSLSPLYPVHTWRCRRHIPREQDRTLLSILALDEEGIGLVVYSAPRGADFARTGVRRTSALATPARPRLDTASSTCLVQFFLVERASKFGVLSCSLGMLLIVLEVQSCRYCTYLRKEKRWPSLPWHGAAIGPTFRTVPSSSVPRPVTYGL